ncbi:hypothetical protein GBA52_012032 [Prunus armeniaca]|nr:hypothetical protein GBA52_012032 [Prunus armeniaca]
MNGNEDSTRGIWVTTYDIAGNEHSMLFKTTKIRKNHKLYWRYFVRHHGLKFKDVVTLWAFRNAQTEKLFCDHFEKVARVQTLFKNRTKLSSLQHEKVYKVDDISLGWIRL